MAPGTHFLFGWLIGASVLKNARERRLIALSSVSSDLDGLGLIIDTISGHTNYYLQYHHYLGHSFIAALAISTIASVIARTQKLKTWYISFIVVHLHIICDIVGSKSPDGFQWPIYYLHPLNTEFGITWKYQWALNSWQNFFIMLCLLMASIYIARTKKITFFEVFSQPLNEAALKMHKKYFLRNS